MGKKKQPNNLGKSLISDRFGKRKTPARGTERESYLHTSELQDGYEWGRLNLQSVTEQSSLDDFLSTAELAGTEFTAEKLNIKFVDLNIDSGLLTDEQKLEVKELQDQHRNLLQIPRRPVWDSTTTPEELDRCERDAFLEWRRTLASLQEVEGIELTPYEKNLDFWRQLWRVIERSDVVVQIVDGRNPLLFHCEDLEAYVCETDPSKVCLILVNKADYLSAQQREMWYQYFNSRGIKVAFWSALDESKRQDEEKEDEEEGVDMEDDDEDDTEEDYEDDRICIRDRVDLEEEASPDSSERLQGDTSTSCEGQKNEILDQDQHDMGTQKDMDTGNSDQSEQRTESDGITMETDRGDNPSQLCHKSDTLETIEEQGSDEILDKENVGMDTEKDVDTGKSDQSEQRTESAGITMETDRGDNPSQLCHTQETAEEQGSVSGGTCDGAESGDFVEGGGKLLNGLELLDVFRSLHTGKKYQQGQTTVGMVGYPNVGKSSTINAILRTKKVPVSATPGRTKHFQTIFVDSDLMLCDCPGLVFPSFVATKADLVINGILPIDQMRDHVGPTSLVCQLIPRTTLEQMYSINLPDPAEGENPSRPPTAAELLNVYGYMRGYMTANGLPDCPRTSRYILKDFVNGRLLYCNPPPDVDVDAFQPTTAPCNAVKRKAALDNFPLSVPNKLDREFFAKADSKIHSKGSKNVENFTRMEGLAQVGAGSSGAGSAPSTPYSSSQSLVDKPWKKHGNRGKKGKLRKTFSHLDDVGKY